VVTKVLGTCVVRGEGCWDKKSCALHTHPQTTNAEGHIISYCTFMEANGTVHELCVAIGPFMVGYEGRRGIKVNEGGEGRALFGLVLVGGLVPSCGGCLA
jgi:hypothetical protein